MRIQRRARESRVQLVPAHEAVLLQLVALFRALRLEDVQPAVYRVTVRWFVVAVSVRVIGVLLAAFEIALD